MVDVEDDLSQQTAGARKASRVVLDWTLDLVFAKDTVQYTSFRAFSQSTRSAPFHDPEQSPHDSEPDDPPTSVGFDPGRSTIWKTEPIVADDFGSKSVSGIDIS